MSSSRKILIVPAVTTLALALGAWSASAGQASSCKISGYQTSPPIFATGQGKGKARFTEGNTSLTYTLEYSGMSSNVTQAHIHFGQPGVNAGVIVFLCDNTKAALSGTPACPATSGSVSGSVTAMDVNPPNNRFRSAAKAFHRETSRRWPERSRTATVTSTFTPRSTLRARSAAS